MRNWAVLLCLVVLGRNAEGNDGRPPNVVVILTDDQGWGDLSLHGNTNLATPNIDSLARDGASFDRFFVCPVCSPTRAEFLTGRYHTRSGVYSTSAGGERMDTDEATIADAFQDAGYATAAFGKWHNGMQFPYHPNARGFDYFYGFCSGHWGHYFSPMLERNNQITKGDGFIIDDLTNDAMKFIERHKSEPFFVYLPYNTPHSPMQVPDRWWKKFSEHELPMRHRDGKEKMPHARAALAMCENIDWNVGRLLAKLKDLELQEDTIVAYFHDNGPNGVRWNGDMKGRKGSTDEGGVRSPLLVRWPKSISPNTKISKIAAAIDLLPTLTDLAGVPQVTGPNKILDGVSLKPLLLNETVDWKDRHLFNFWRGKLSVRSQRFRLDQFGHLFKLAEDPGQRTDVSADHESTVEEMKHAADRWRATVAAELPKTDPRPFVIGHPDSPYTQLPARDGVAHGNIRRSNRFPNCSYFTNWTSKDDRITWTAELPTSGRFAVDMYYTCAQSDVGSEIELSIGNQKLESRITVPHDPPLVGAAEDRFDRQESYVKEFRPMRLGEIAIEQGKAEIALKATMIANENVAEFRMLYLTRVE